VVVVVVVVEQGFGEQVPAPRAIPPCAAHCAGVSTVQVSKAPIGDDCTQHSIVPHTGRSGSPVQVQRNALHWSVMFFAQLMEGWGPHASLISSLQAVVLSHLPLLSAIAEEERKTPTPSATAAKNVTTAFLVIVEPPVAVPMQRSISAL
jgi:hypothetical protein